MWKNIVERGRPQMTIWRMRTACWIPKATDTHSEYVILMAFPIQQWFFNLNGMLLLTIVVEVIVDRCWGYWRRLVVCL
jgi:hypothetical protein